MFTVPCSSWIVFSSKNNHFCFWSMLFPADKLITLEAMSGLSKVLLYLDKKNVHLLVVYIFMKIKPFLESVSLL